jgi:putative SOS response-associated peptidase YedK
MCGRFTLAVDAAELQQAFPQFSFPAQVGPRFNIAPTQPVLALANDGRLQADFFTWGLIPSWAKDPAIGSRMINARSEGVETKPSFRGPLKYKRCLVFASGFYEWKTVPGQKAKIPHHIRLKSGRPFAFAGLWDEWHAPDGSQIRSATILTTSPNALMEAIHNRMPVILPESAYAQWIEPAPLTPERLLPLLQPYPADGMIAHPVSTLVNSPANDRPECIVPA